MVTSFKHFHQLSKQKRKILTYIYNFAQANQYSPSQQEIADGLETTQPAISKQMNALKELDMVTFDPAKARSLLLTQSALSVIEYELYNVSDSE